MQEAIFTVAVKLL